MNLIDTQTEKFCYLNASKVPDGEGGIITKWTDGAEFDAVASMDDSMQAKIAQKMDVTAIYSITTKKNITLAFPDVIKRLSDGEIFRITSDGKDKKTPEGAGLTMRKVSAEKWKLKYD